MNSSEANQRRSKRALFLMGCLLLLCGNWPVVTIVNRAGPTIFGLPPFVASMFLLNLAVAGLLIVAYRKLD